MTKKIVIVDYGIGNLYSVRRALEVSGAEKIIISDDPLTISHADGLVLPGVGSFADGMRGLQERGLINSIISYVNSGRPILGICLGMQMLATFSEEFGLHKGLDLIPGRVVAIPNLSIDGQLLKVPFIGWANIAPSNLETYKNSLINLNDNNSAVYFVHSFYMRPTNPENLLATYSFGGHAITAAIQRDNVFGLQFHPERSGRVGLDIMSKFVSII